MMRFAFFLLVSYFAAAPLTSLIELDVTATTWTSLWTYLIWFFALTIWVAIFAVVVPLGAAVFTVLFER